MADWEIIITGCGTSHGNPVWGDPAWWSTDPRDARRRSGAILRGPHDEVVLIDTGTDLLYQLRDPYRRWDGLSYPVEAIEHCNAVLLTHDHADHTHGINDLRLINRLMRRHEHHALSIPVYAHQEHLRLVQSMFPFCFAHGEEIYSLATPALSGQELRDDVQVEVAGLPVIPFAMSHGPAGRTTGFRIGGMAYLTDFKVLPAAADRHLRGLDLLVLDMLREEVHPTHLCWSEAQAVIARLRPRRTVLTHMGPEVRYAEWEHRLPPGVEMAVDGWRTSFSATLEPEP